MSSSNEIRQLAGIMFTDIVGYTRMMGEDEARTRQVLANQRKLLFPIVEQHEGKVLKEMGDGLLIMFTSVIKAVRCAIEIQNAEKDFVLRIGIHIGDVVIENDDVFGSGVNIAARVEGLASPGSVCITADVWHQISNQTDLYVKSLGVKDLKGVHESVEVFEITKEEIQQSKAENITSLLSRRPAILRKKPFIIGLSIVLLMLIGLYFFMPDRTVAPQIESSIAVLPFENLSPDLDDAYFADGVHEDIIVHLSQIGDLHVIARSSVLSFQPGERNLVSVANELNVATVLEGNIRRAGDIVRVSVQLIDPRSNQSLWANTFDREITDLFVIQSEIAREVAGALEVRMTDDEGRAIERVHTENLEAYRYYILGRELLAQRTREPMWRAVEHFRESIKRDERYALAWVGLADALTLLHDYGYEPPEEVLPQAEEAVHKALELEPRLGEAYASLGLLHSTRGEGPSAIRELERAVELRPNYAEAHNWISWVSLLLGERKNALKSAQTSVALDPLSAEALSNLSLSYLVNGDAEAALREARVARSVQFELGSITLGTVLYHMARYEDVIGTLQDLTITWVGEGTSSIMALAYVALGDDTSAREILAGIKGANDPFSVGLIYAALEEYESAFEYFDKIDYWDYWPILSVRYFFADILNPLQNDPRFREYQKEIDRQWGL